MKKPIHTSLYWRAVGYIMFLLPSFFVALASAKPLNTLVVVPVASDPESLGVKDSVIIKNHLTGTDSLMKADKKGEFIFNDDARRFIQFDFMPSSPPKDVEFKKAPPKKKWMEFQVDLSVPKNLTDTTRARKPEKYVRMLPYSIWSLFGQDPAYDVLVFGTKKRLEMMWKLNLDKLDDYGRNIRPHAGSYDPNRTRVGSSVVVGDLDFIGFLYNNLNKHGRLLRHNRKHANAWKTYNKTAPILSSEMYVATVDSIRNTNRDSYNEGRPVGDEKGMRDEKATQHEVTDKNAKATKNAKKVKGKKKSKDDHTLDELPNSMEDLYKYIHAKQQQDSIRRKENARKDKVEQNVYELEQQIRKLKERQN